MEEILIASWVETAKFRVLMHDKLRWRATVEVFEAGNPELIGYRFYVPFVEEDFDFPERLPEIMRDRSERILMSQLTSPREMPKEGTLF